MKSASFILSKLPLYTGTVEVIADDQSVYDIIRGVKEIHRRYAADYDKIAQYFIGHTAEDTCRNIFNFLRRSAFYYIEGEDIQTLRSPSAILATGKVHGIDCKNYALFIGGVLDAINRSGEQYIPYCYRFASDKLFDPTPCHVFVVAFPGTQDEMWVDPIPQVTYFDERLTYYYHTDKNYKAMLQVLSGRSVGEFTGQNIVDVGGQILTGNWGAAAGTIISNIFSSGGPNPNDWQGWHSDGADARYWVLHDGDSVANEAVNILSWIKNRGMATMLVTSSGVPAVTPQQIAQKLSRAGFGVEAQQFLNMGNTGTSIIPGNTDPKKAEQNKLITYGLIGAGVLLVMNQRKKVSGINNTTLLIGAGVAAYLLLRKKDTINVTGELTPTQLTYEVMKRYPGVSFSNSDLDYLQSQDPKVLAMIANGDMDISAIAS